MAVSGTFSSCFPQRVFPGGLASICALLFVLLSSSLPATAAARQLCATAVSNADTCGVDPTISRIACSVAGSPVDAVCGTAVFPYLSGAIVLNDGVTIAASSLFDGAQSPVHCCQLCASDIPCDAWTYDVSTRDCYAIQAHFCASSTYQTNAPTRVALQDETVPGSPGTKRYYHGTPIRLSPVYPQGRTYPRCQAPESCPAPQANCVASPLTLDATTSCAAPAPTIDQINVGSLLANKNPAQDGQLRLTLANGTLLSDFLGLGEHSVRLTVSDGAAQSSCDVTVKVVDNEGFDSSRLIWTPALSTITPSQASLAKPAVFSATYTKLDGCLASVSVTPGSVTCTRCNKPGQNEKPDCRVSTEGATVTITNSGGVRNRITWDVSVTSPTGPDGPFKKVVTSGVCVEQPSGKKEVCEPEWIPGQKVPGC